MNRRESQDAFFVGYVNALPGALAWFAPMAGLAFVATFFALGFLGPRLQSDPGDGRFLWEAGEQTFNGVLEARPYPMVHVEANDRFPSGRTLLLGGDGKRGVQRYADRSSATRVTVTGVLLKRGALDMLQVARAEQLKASPLSQRPARPAPARSLGRWRLTGEICDGKCYAGAMRPGRGLAHKACANLCLIGGLPPVFVASGAVAGRSFLLMGDENGGPVAQRLLDHVALLVEAEGEIEERGDLLIFKLDPKSLRVL